MNLVERIQGVLAGMSGVTAWKINEVLKSAEELYFVKKTLDMNRSKDVHICDVTIYVEFSEGEDRYLGQSTTEIAPTMTDNEIKFVLEDAKLGASFVKNAYYELPSPSGEMTEQKDSTFKADSLASFMPKLTNAIYKPDTFEAGGLNSVEIFLNRYDRRVVNSKGIDVNFRNYHNMVEVITEWNDCEEPVESFRIMNFGDFMPEVLSEDVAQLIDDSKDRANAIDAPNLKDMRIILSGEAVKQFFEYYIGKANARSVYEKVSTYEIGQKIQGSEVSGDLLNIELLPYLEGSSKSSPYDSDGVKLEPLTLIKDGQLKAISGEHQFTSYMNMPTTGRLSNFKVSTGGKSVEDYKQSPYVELLAFSAFQMNFISGEFGGEIRLGKYFDGEKTVSISGGAISSDISKVQGNMRFSKEQATIDNYVGPKHVILEGLELAGK